MEYAQIEYKVNQLLSLVNDVANLQSRMGRLEQWVSLAPDLTQKMAGLTDKVKNLGNNYQNIMDTLAKQDQMLKDINAALTNSRNSFTMSEEAIKKAQIGLEKATLSIDTINESVLPDLQKNISDTKIILDKNVSNMTAFIEHSKVYAETNVQYASDIADLVKQCDEYSALADEQIKAHYRCYGLDIGCKVATIFNALVYIVKFGGASIQLFNKLRDSFNYNSSKFSELASKLKT